MAEAKIFCRVALAELIVSGAGDKGAQYNVSSFLLTLEEGVIPSLLVEIDPHPTEVKSVSEQIKKTESADSGRSVKVDTLKLDSYFELHSAFSKAVDAKVKATFRARLEYSDGAITNITLKDWVLVASGFNDITADGNMAFGLQLKHPAVNLEQSISALPDMYILDMNAGSDAMATETPDQGVVAESNPVSAYISIAERYSDFTNTVGDGPDKPYRIDAAKTFTQMASLLKQYIHIGPDVSWPTVFDSITPDITKTSPGGESSQTSITNDAQRYMKYAIEQSIKRLDSDTVWNNFAGQFLPEWFLSVKPTFDKDFLIVNTFNPWASPAYKIDLGDCSSIQLPATDTKPVRGISLGAKDAALLHGFSTYNKDAKPEDKETYTIFTVNAKIGNILPMQFPAWIYTIITHVIAQIKKDDFSTQNTSESDVATEAEISALVHNNYQAFLAYAKAVFLQYYKSALDISFKGKLSIVASRTGGSASSIYYMYPGLVYELVFGDKIDILCYITKIKHFASMKEKVAYTEYSGSFIRDKSFELKDADSQELIKNGSAGSPLYTITNQETPPAAEPTSSPQLAGGGGALDAGMPA